MAATIFLFAYAGVKLDEWLSLKFPAFTLGLTLTGLAGSLYYMIKELSNFK
jgi:hypothetical protein